MPTTRKKRATKKAPLRLNLALQGGGAHGAFTWGVLDRILEDEEIEIVGISGTSAGAMNAAILVDGHHEGGNERARAQLREFWKGIADASVNLMSLCPSNPAADMVSHIPGMDWLSSVNPMDMLSRVFSPYDLNPLNLNPLRDVLEGLVNPKHLQGGIKLFVAATNVETGEPHVFTDKQITIDVLLASACLPFMYQAVEIEGVPYWDGGYVGNPAIWPLIYKTDCADVMLVQINPLRREGAPRHAGDIINRVNEISFNASLIAEMRAIHFVQKLVRSGKLSDKEYTDVRMHRVLPPLDAEQMNAASKNNTSWEFFQALFGLGRAQMSDWLAQHRHDIGVQETLSIEKHFLAKPKRTMSGTTKEK